MKKWKGSGVSAGIVLGEAHFLDASPLTFPKFWISEREVKPELYRFKKIMEGVQRQLYKIREKLCKFQIGDEIRILDSFQMIAKDEILFSSTLIIIKNEKINAEWALDKSLKKIKSAFLETDSEYFRERRADIDHVGKLIMNNLLSGETLETKRFKKGTILLTHDLSPADTAQIARGGIEGFITETGGKTSHTAIIARALEIPAITGVEGITRKVSEGEKLLLNGGDGLVFQNPDAKQKNKYIDLRRQQDKVRKLLLKDVHLPTITKDNFSLRLAANMELLEEIPLLKKYGAQGVGLYRTEFLYLTNRSLPTEEQHYKAYKKILSSSKPFPVTIRTLDIGGDKILPDSEYLESVNPALGLRAIRFCLKEKKLFKIQLRAMLRASIHGKLKILIPMVTTIEEIKQVKKILSDVQADFKKNRIRFSKDIKFGVMIEVPSAALMADSIASEVDFISIGTNDLIQYTLATDRVNDQVDYLYEATHPAVLKLLMAIVKAARQKKVEVSLCGEMAGDPLYLMLLLGLGLSELSMNPLSIPRVKKILRQVTFKQAADMLEKALICKTSAEVKSLIKREMSKIWPLTKAQTLI